MPKLEAHREKVSYDATDLLEWLREHHRKVENDIAGLEDTMKDTDYGPEYLSYGLTFQNLGALEKQLRTFIKIVHPLTTKPI